MSKIFLLFFIFILFLPNLSLSAELPSIEGNYKSFFSIIDNPDLALKGNPVKGSVSNRLRLKSSYTPFDWLYLQLAYDLSFEVEDTTGTNSPFSNLLSGQRYRIDDLNSRIFPSRDDDYANFGIYQNLDRLSATFRVPFADITVGRQVVAWGNARVVNPTDIISPFTFDSLDTEERPGVDALRLLFPIGFMGELDGGIVFGKEAEFDKNTLYLRGKYYIFESDISLLIMDFQKNLLLGFNFARSIAEAGFWCESAYVFSGLFVNEEVYEDYFRFSIGSDYSFTENTYSFLEYHWNQAGINEPEDYLNQIAKAAYTDGSVYFLGQHYLIPGISYQVTPLINAELRILANLSDFSVLIYPFIEYNIATDIYLSLGGFIGIGKKPDLKSTTFNVPDIRLRSEFGGYPDVYFSSFRLYF
ncbi:hypothetical protein GF312_16410 [Candidatus Poribacteria bacterium]|nr:hypothetical protein [Candidatus Poribacteria bacterium]